MPPSTIHPPYGTLSEGLARLAQLLEADTPTALGGRSTAVLSLGTRDDAARWESGCAGLGIRTQGSLREPRPGHRELTRFFRLSPHWAFFAGHFVGRRLYNEADSVSATFGRNRVELEVEGSEGVHLDKGTPAFGLDRNCEVVVWGGCSVCSSTSLVEDLFALFGPHLLLGFAGVTGWSVIYALLGGPGSFMEHGEHFFERVRGRLDDPVAIRDAWMRAAAHGWGTGNLENRFRAFDPDGQEWKLEGRNVVKGRKIAV